MKRIYLPLKKGHPFKGEGKAKPVSKLVLDKADKKMTLEEVNAKIEELERKELSLLERAEKLRQKTKIEWVPLNPNPPQKKMLEAWLDPTKKVFTFTGGNRSTKTTTGLWLALATMFGFFPWNEDVKLPFSHTMPRRVRLVGQDWERHIKTVLEPKLHEWWPVNRAVKIRKNNQGVDAYWEDVKTGSSLEILSNLSDSEVAEGWDGDLIMYDEPPKRDMRVACARGLIDRLGREYFGMTLLKEAWVHREVIKAVNSDGTPDESVFNIHATIFDNIGFGITEEGEKQFEKTLTKEEKDARLWGIPSYMSNIIWSLNRQLHLRKRFPVPLDWIVDIEIDFHPAKPWAVLFVATDPRNFKWVVDEMWMHGNPKFIAEEIIRRIHLNQYRVEYPIGIDPLAKGDSNNEETVFTIMQNTFASRNLWLRPSSKDKDNGITIVRNLMMTQNEMPAIFFFNDLKCTIDNIENWVVDPETLKPSKDKDDFCECLYRIALRHTQWSDPMEYEREEPRKVVNLGRSAYTGY